MKRTIENAIEDFLIEGDEDYIGLWEVIIEISIILEIDTKKMSQTEAKKFWDSLSDLIAKMLRAGFVVGHLVKRGGFDAWPEQEPKQVLTEIRNKWVEYKGDINDVGFSIWFNKLNKQPRPRKPRA